MMGKDRRCKYVQVFIFMIVIPMHSVVSYLRHERELLPTVCIHYIAGRCELSKLFAELRFIVSKQKLFSVPCFYMTRVKIILKFCQLCAKIARSVMVTKKSFMGSPAQFPLG
jgi:hypothetical protein